MLLANVAFGMILFELGYRINLRWLRVNPWLGITSLIESGATFAAVYLVARWFNMPFIPSLLLSSLAMATSPVAVLLVSASIGGLFGVAVPGLLSRIGNTGRDATVAFAIAVIMLVALTHALNFSPVPATMAFGLMARHRRAVFSQAQRNFGALGNLLTVLLFVFMAAALDWQIVKGGFWLSLALMAVKRAAKNIGVVGFARAGGITWRKGLLTGIALTPLSGFFILLLLEQTRHLGTRHLGIGLMDQLTAPAAITLLLEVLGPVATQWALVWAKEAPDSREL